METFTPVDVALMKHAVRLAEEAERNGNLPIGAVVTYGTEIVSEGMNRIWKPESNPTGHAEIEAIQNIPESCWNGPSRLSVYTTLEPCVMCLGAILLSGIGRVVYGSKDRWAASSPVFGHLPPLLDSQRRDLHWIGPVLPEHCDALFDRVVHLVKSHDIGTGTLIGIGAPEQ